ncbi:CTLH/CRA C-terminal to lish motif domain-containing protein [Terfezia claveryi]|nr:CTLH/CRA C-terminal to lish motif domain-containing protein [Terfezia claveryi]
MASTTSGATRRAGGIDWDKRVDDVKVSKTDLNNLVMNYLIIEGYESAALKFAQEANITPQYHFYDIQDRVQIRSAIHSGDIDTAIQRINDLYPEMLDTNPSLHFSLLRLQLIELIRACTSSPDGDISEALNFATTRLAPRAPGNPAFLQDLERTMALLCFPPESLAPPLSELMDPALRRNVAAKVNEAILESAHWMKEAKIRGLVRLRGWAEQKLPGLPPMSLGLDIDGTESPDAMAT